MKALLLSLMIQASFSGVLYAEETTPIQTLNLSLDYMSLTPAEIKKRDKLLAPIYDNYQNINLSSVSNALEKTYGLNIYHHMLGKELNLKDKKNVMENAIRYYNGDESLFNNAAPGVVSYKAEMSFILPSNSYYSNSEKFPELKLAFIEGNEDKWQDFANVRSPSILTTSLHEQKIRDVFFRSDIGTRKAVFTSVKNPLFSAPVMSNFLEAMKNLNLKGLDASVVFVTGEIYSSESRKESVQYKVLYPNFSKLAPIPQATIYIAKNATTEEIMEMLSEHAPRIFAYNKLFNANLLPTVAEINDILKKHPNIIAEVEKKVGKVRRENLVNAVQAAFLNVTYGTGILIATPIALGAMAASAVFSPIFIATVIILI